MWTARGAHRLHQPPPFSFVGLQMIQGAPESGGRRRAASDGAALSACKDAFADAADARIEGNDPFDLDPAMRTRRSLADWSAASRQYPTALDGVDPRTVAENRCLTARIDRRPICRELGIGH